jgi:hypothetical protein
MLLVFEDRPSDSPVVERVWRCQSDRAGAFLSVAASHFEMAVTRQQGQDLPHAARAGDEGDDRRLSLRG